MACIRLITISNYDPVTFEGTAAALSKVPGLVSTYIGTQIEDATCAQVVLRWKALEDHSRFMSSDIYDNLLKQTEVVSPRNPTVARVEPSSSIETVLSAPVTEFAMARLRSSSDRSEWEKCLETTLNGITETKGAIAGVHGTTETNPDEYVFVIGWESLEVSRQSPDSSFA
ncbi:hypothetical protein EVG20_g2278 [Dentipellis fragilis]|uniref:ABM domain-containing protein n=1 Tax=Dentipellis fragilis TaxID=205917 RepID=A0A4Y9ZAA8_9AGAM|nr:hypothetical protein EVG20_g2278 [Dentipellis fragilis]